MLNADNFGERLAELLLDPVLQRSQGFLFVLKLFGQAGQEVGLARDELGFHPLQHLPKYPRPAPGAGSQTVGPEISRLPQLLRPADAHRHAGQRFHQRHAQQQREGPQFRNRERRNLLVLPQAILDVSLVQTVVGVHCQLAGKFVDVRIPGFSGGKDVLVTVRQVAADLRDLRADQVAIIEQPLRRHRQHVVEAHRLRQNGTRCLDNPLIA